MIRRSCRWIALILFVLVTATSCAGTYPTPRFIRTAAIENLERDENGVPFEQFFMSPPQEDTPEDILQEVVYVGGANGGGGCGKGYSNPTVMSVSSLLPGERSSMTQDFELHDTLYISTCGWGSSELVTATIQYPTGGTESHALRTELYDLGDGTFIEAGIDISFTTSLSDPAGVYTFTFEGENGEVRQEVMFVEPVGPRLYLEDNGQLMLHNFEPGERVRVFAYTNGPDMGINHSLVAWQTYQVSSNGQLYVRAESLESGTVMFVAVGDVSGEVIPFGYVLFDDSILAGYVEGAAGLDKIEVRGTPDTQGTIIEWVPSGVQMRAFGRHQDSEGNIWWHVRLAEGTEGWVLDNATRRSTE